MFNVLQKENFSSNYEERQIFIEKAIFFYHIYISEETTNFSKRNFLLTIQQKKFFIELLEEKFFLKNFKIQYIALFFFTKQCIS